MFFVGYRWAQYTNFNPWAAAGTLVALGLTLVLIAVPLGGGSEQTIRLVRSDRFHTPGPRKMRYVVTPVCRRGDR